MTTYKPLVKRMHYRKLKQSPLNVFAANVVDKTKGAEYDPLRKELNTLDTMNKEYATWLAAAVGKGTVVVAEKDLMKKGVLVALDEVSQKLDENADGDYMYILRAGMEAQKEPQMHTGELPIPFDVIATSNGVKGEALVKFKIADRTGIEMFAIEWSLDKEVWHNGIYTKGTRGVATGLPNRKDVYFQVIAIGTRKRKSKPSQNEATCFVL